MKAVIAAVAVLCCLAFATPAHAWDCTTPGYSRQQVPAGTVGAGQGDGTNQVDTVEGITFECLPQTPPTPPPTSSTSSNSTSSASSASSSNSSASSNQNQSQKQNQTANGGSANATATGGQGGSASVGNVSSTLKNSGNSSNKNTNTATGGNQSQTSSATATGNGDNSNDYSSTTNVPREVATAYSPNVLPTTPCFKGYSGGGQGTMFGFSFGGGKIDANCRLLETARQAPSLLARCKVWIRSQDAKSSGVSLDDCIGQPVVQIAAVVPVAPSAPIIVPAPQVNVYITQPTVIPAPVVAPAPSVAAAAPKKHFHPNCTPKAPLPCKVIDNDNIGQQ